jgi:hypothetical protein
LAQADDPDTLANLVIHTVIDADNYLAVTISGVLYHPSHAIGTAGDPLFLSPSSAGAFTTTDPADSPTTGEYSQPLGVVFDDDFLALHAYEALEL